MDTTPHTSTQKPVAKVKSGAVVGTIWQNEGQNGPFYTITFSRSYKDREGNWQRTSNLRHKDMPHVQRPWPAWSRRRSRSWLPKRKPLRRRRRRRPRAKPKRLRKQPVAVGDVPAAARAFPWRGSPLRDALFFHHFIEETRHGNYHP